jgi:hypothetical protein
MKNKPDLNQLQPSNLLNAQKMAPKFREIAPLRLDLALVQTTLIQT